MYAAHFAAGLALKGRSPRTSLTLLLLAAFLLDFLWIAFGVSGVDRTPWDDWSHSLLMALVWSSLFCLVVWRQGTRACAVVWLAVFSHFVLDLIVQGATLYPHAPKAWLIPPPVTQNTGILQAGICIALLGVYFLDARRAGVPRWRALLGVAIALATNLR